MADFDADGHVDLITGCFEGGSYLLRGKKGPAFHAPKPVRDQSGRLLRLGQYWDTQGRRWTGVDSSKFKEFLGISATPVDWDGDGDLDLLLGSNKGRVFVRINEGTKKVTAFATESLSVKAGGLDLKVKSGHAMPVAADWDGDGRFDILSGSNSGAVYWYRNVGRKGAPEFEAARTLVRAKAGSSPQLGKRTQVTVADYDGDGRMDLFVGDFRSTQKADGGRTYHGWVWLFRRKPATG